MLRKGAKRTVNQNGIDRIGPEDIILATEERWARRTLEKSGIRGTLPEIARQVSRGTPEWLAWLHLVWIPRLRAGGPQTIEDAYRLGFASGAAGIRSGFRLAGADGGSQEKKLRPVEIWLRRTVRQYPDKSESFCWNSIPQHDDDDRPLKAGGADLIREGNVLVVSYRDGRRRTLSRASFRRYLRDARKPKG